jgi:hypothetical protein
LHVDVEGGLVELDDIDAGCRQFARLLVQQRGKCHRQRDLVAVMLVGDRVDDRHRSGQRKFEAAACMGPGYFGLEAMHAPPAPKRAGNNRHFRIVAVVANAHCDPAAKIDAVDLLEKTVDEVLARLLAVGDDVDARVFLLLQPQQCRVALRRQERLAFEAPWRPQHSRLRQPGRFRQAAGNRRLEHPTFQEDGDRPIRTSAAIEDVVAEILHFEDCGVRTSDDRLG